MSKKEAFVDRHELIRANWILANEASWHLSDRRRAAQLRRRANEIDRQKAGAAQSSHHEGKIDPIAKRWIDAGDSAKEKLARVALILLVIAPVLLITAGPAMTLAAGLYYWLWLRQPQKGAPLREKPWLLAGGLVGVLGAILWALAGAPVPFGASPWPPTLIVYTVPFACFVLWSQLTLGLLLTGVRIRQFGWPGVKDTAGKSAPKLTLPGTQSKKLPTLPGDNQPAVAQRAAPAVSVAVAEVQAEASAAPAKRKLPTLPKPRAAAPVAPAVQEEGPEEPLDYEPWMDVQFEDAPLLDDEIDDINNSKEN